MFRYTKTVFYLLISITALSLPFYANSEEFTASVKSIDVTKHAANYDASMEGQLKYIARLGALREPYITRIDNDYVIEGIPIFQYNLPYWQSLVKGYEELTVSSGMQLDEARLNAIRYNIMASEDAVSDQQRETYLNTYMIALNTYATNKAMIQNKYEDIREATFRAPFEGMVTKVYQSSGLATGSNVVEFTQLNPIGLEIEMERSKARKIGNKVVKVYPNSINNPQGIIYRHSMLTEKGIIFITENYPLSTFENPDPDAIIHRIFALVIPFQIGTMDTYGVRADTLSKDEHGDYVWLALNENDSVLPADKNSRIFSVVKVYVEPTGLHRMNSGFGEIHQIKPSPSLKFGDVLIGLPPKHLKDGDKMYLAESKYILMPGETVKVVIEDF